MVHMHLDDVAPASRLFAALTLLVTRCTSSALPTNAAPQVKAVQTHVCFGRKLFIAFIHDISQLVLTYTCHVYKCSVHFEVDM